MGKPTSPEHHELAGRFLVAKELCLDLATNHASRIAENVKQCEVRNRYEAIARSFYCVRVKRRSLFQQVMLNKAVERFRKSCHEEERFEDDLLAAYHDLQYSLDRRRAALREIEELREQWKQLEEQQHVEIVRLSLPTGHYPPKVQRLICRFRKDGREKFFNRLDSAIRRFLKASVGGAQWTASTPITRLAVSMSLLQLLALEWLRDKEALWCFLEACINRWEAVTDPTGIHKQNVMMHNIYETGEAWDANGKNVIEPKQKMLWQ